MLEVWLLRKNSQYNSGVVISSASTAGLYIWPVRDQKIAI